MMHLRQTLFIKFAAILFIIDATAQHSAIASDLGLSLCQKVQSDAERLKCYDNLGKPVPDGMKRTLQEDISYRGIPLGSTLDEFRKRRHPDAGQHPNAKPICSGDRAMGNTYSLYSLPRELSRVGIIWCQFYEPTKRKSDPWSSANPDFGDARTIDTAFYFTPSTFPEEHQQSLYQVSMTIHVNWYGQVLSALTAKYGAPSETRSDKISNGLGASFTNEISIWRGPTTSVQISKYDDTINHSSVQFFHKPSLNAVTTAVMNLAKEDASKL